MLLLLHRGIYLPPPIYILSRFPFPLYPSFSLFSPHPWFSFMFHTSHPPPPPCHSILQNIYPCVFSFSMSLFTFLLFYSALMVIFVRVNRESRLVRLGPHQNKIQIQITDFSIHFSYFMMLYRLIQSIRVESENGSGNSEF